MTHSRAREMRLRRAASRQGLKLHKSPRRDPLAIDYDEWWLTVGDRVMPNTRARGLDHIERLLRREVVS